MENPDRSVIRDEITIRPKLIEKKLGMFFVEGIVFILPKKILSIFLEIHGIFFRNLKQTAS
jgi:hypothetical protein